LASVELAWRGVVGQRSGITWHYVQMLAGISGIKPDRMITRFVADAPELPRSRVTPGLALQILVAFRVKGIAATDIAKMLGVSRATVYRYLADEAA
jgi:Helix-turn-helix domain of resolvase